MNITPLTKRQIFQGIKITETQPILDTPLEVRGRLQFETTLSVVESICLSQGKMPKWLKKEVHDRARHELMHLIYGADWIEAKKIIVEVQDMLMKSTDIHTAISAKESLEKLFNILNPYEVK